MSRSDSPDSEQEGHERFMPMVDAASMGGRGSGPYSGGGGDGTESVRRMARAFGLFEPDEEQTITADSQITRSREARRDAHEH